MAGNGSKKHLMWEESFNSLGLGSKRLFCRFIGAHSKRQKKQRAFPLLLTSEQLAALDKQLVRSKSEPRAAGKKRKRCEKEGQEEGEEGRVTRNRCAGVNAQGWFGGVAQLVQAVASAVLSPFVGFLTTVEGDEKGKSDGKGVKEGDNCEVKEEEEGGDCVVERGEDAVPSTHQEWRCKVFLDLTKKGYVVGPGAAFGGDYVIYRST